MTDHVKPALPDYVKQAEEVLKKEMADLVATAIRLDRLEAEQRRQHDRLVDVERRLNDLERAQP